MVDKGSAEAPQEVLNQPWKQYVGLVLISSVLHEVPSRPCKWALKKGLKVDTKSTYYGSNVLVASAPEPVILSPCCHKLG